MPEREGKNRRRPESRTIRRPAVARPRGRAARLLATWLLACGCTPSNALGTPSVDLHATLSPDTLGHRTTISVRVRVVPRGELVPPPVIAGELHYPAGLNVELSGLGIEACTLSRLELLGPRGCPPDSRMGHGSVIAEAPIKGEAFSETAKIAILRAPEQSGHQALVLWIYGETGVSIRRPVIAYLLSDARPFGGILDLQVPPISTFPEGPDISVTEVDLVLGPASLVYYERVRGKRIAYRPTGVVIPRRCPRGGFPFSVQLGFLGGGQAADRATAACPHRQAGHRGHGRG